MRPLVRLAAILALLAATPTAFAQPAAPAIAGVWRFETAPYNDGVCRMNGAMTIVQGRTRNDYTCTFTATEHCGERAWNAEQRCTAQRSGDRLDISSVIVRLTPPGLSYAPDNWTLAIRTSDLMVGELRSASIANVQFRRGPALVS